MITNKLEHTKRCFLVTFGWHMVFFFSQPHNTCLIEFLCNTCSDRSMLYTCLFCFVWRLELAAVGLICLLFKQEHDEQARILLFSKIWPFSYLKQLFICSNARTTQTLGDIILVESLSHILLLCVWVGVVVHWSMMVQVAVLRVSLEVFR